MKTFIQNRKKQKIAVIVEENENPRGLVFVMHGLSGCKDQSHIKAFASAFSEKGFAVIRFDTTNTLGESDGDLIDATLTNYYEDLEDVIRWSESQSWHQEPFVLVGHSLGAISSILFAEKYPEKVKAIAPISTVVSGELTEDTPDFKAIADEWEKKGIREWESSSQPGVVKRLKWSHVEDRRKYDSLLQVQKLTMPVLMIVGDLDNVTPLEHQQLFFDKLPGKKEIHVIKGAEHTFKEKEHLEEIREIFKKWIEGNL
ncbi:MAG TPA: hypothetical protein DCX32_00555 [Candidatus Moranbacteria bacterium]|nr:MAG: OsmC-like protein family protein [Candidatus Moranbacteria bacterium GW2011_GWC2_45_10]KKT95567.1 MAG: hypothetical protein UW95_C0001G0131 [Parcubacteria group bacterium GW2011_GWC1_45_14]HAV11028.1 hypothetical protein [Candidatus Moranbacteria bacterium]